MAHKKTKKEAGRKFVELALWEARRCLESAIEWIDDKDLTWAQVQTQRALDLLKAARDL